MFEALSDKLKKVLKDLKGEGKLTEAHIDAAMREIRIALLEADVNFKVVKEFVESVKQKALGQEVMQALSPGQQVIKIVNDELVSLLGGTSTKLVFTQRIPNVVMMVGLQGSGKTTSTGKLSLYLSKNEKRNPLMVSVDVYRPAARNQLSVIGKAINKPVFEYPESDDPLTICRAAFKHAQQVGFDTLLIDTAGRLHIDDQLMTELQQIKREMVPAEILFVADAMTGQDAVKSAKEFHDRVGISGVMLTKMDGDARGGGALSIKYITGQPIKFIGVGEKYDALEQFYPDRIASRILGMGDVLSLIEKVQSEVDEKQAEELERKLAEDSFTMEDYRDQLKQMKKLGSFDKLLSMIPEGLFGGMNLRLTPEQMQQAEEKLKRTEAIINSMTPYERENHKVVVMNGDRRKRIAAGSGSSIQEVMTVVNEYSEMRKMMRMVAGGGMMGGAMGKMARRLTGMGPKKKHHSKKKKKRK
ncbi:MAG TPA: signal recognition particle protein [Blastocatellia bacterium]|nr:signal recognition particle protein [Blastocatellia bacterium]